MEPTLRSRLNDLLFAEWLNQAIGNPKKHALRNHFIMEIFLMDVWAYEIIIILYSSGEVNTDEIVNIVMVLSKIKRDDPGADIRAITYDLIKVIIGVVDRYIGVAAKNLIEHKQANRFCHKINELLNVFGEKRAFGPTRDRIAEILSIFMIPVHLLPPIQPKESYLNYTSQILHNITKEVGVPLSVLMADIPEEDALTRRRMYEQVCYRGSRTEPVDDLHINFEELHKIWKGLPIYEAQAPNIKWGEYADDAIKKMDALRGGIERVTFSATIPEELMQSILSLTNKNNSCMDNKNMTAPDTRTDKQKKRDQMKQLENQIDRLNNHKLALSKLSDREGAPKLHVSYERAHVAAEVGTDIKGLNAIGIGLACDAHISAATYMKLYLSEVDETITDLQKQLDQLT